MLAVFNQDLLHLRPNSFGALVNCMVAQLAKHVVWLHGVCGHLFNEAGFEEGKTECQEVFLRTIKSLSKISSLKLSHPN